MFRSLGFKLFAALLTYGLVNVTWVFFRSQSFEQAGRMLVSMFSVPAGVKPLLYPNDLIAVGVVIGAMLVAQWRLRDTSFEAVVTRTPAWLIAVVWTAIGFLTIISQGSENAFIYFQF